MIKLFSKSPDVPEICKDPLEKTIGDYILEGLSNKLEELKTKLGSDLDLSHLEYTLPHLTDDMGASVNLKALQRLTSSRLPFIPTKVITMFFTNEDYSALRKLYDFKGYKNLETLRYDRKKFIQGLKCFGVKEKDIREFRNANYETFKDTFNKVQMECKENDKAGEKTLVLFSYGGHGIQIGGTRALLNTTERIKINFQIEERVRILSMMPSTYVVAFFDCCREVMTLRDIQ